MAFNAISDQLKMVAAQDDTATDGRQKRRTNLVLSTNFSNPRSGFSAGLSPRTRLQLIKTVGYLIVWVIAALAPNHWRLELGNLLVGFVEQFGKCGDC